MSNEMAIFIIFLSDIFADNPTIKSIIGGDNTNVKK